MSFKTWSSLCIAFGVCFVNCLIKIRCRSSLTMGGAPKMQFLAVNQCDAYVVSFRVFHCGDYSQFVFLLYWAVFTRSDTCVIVFSVLLAICCIPYLCIVVVYLISTRQIMTDQNCLLSKALRA